MHGIEHRGENENARHGSVCGERDQQRIGRGKEGQAREKTPGPAEGNRVGADPAEQVALAIARLVGQVTGGEYQREKAADGNATSVDRRERGVAKQKVQDAADKMKQRVEQGKALHVKQRSGIKRAQACDRQRENDRGLADKREQQETQKQERRRDEAELAAAYAFCREGSRRSIGVSEIAVNSRPVVERIDVRHQAAAAHGKDSERQDVVPGPGAERKTCSDQWGTLKDENFVPTDAGQEA